MDQEKLKTPGIAALILGICLVLSSVVVVSGIYGVKSLSDSISVTGSAEKVITSDVVKWRSSFSRSVDAPSIASGYARMKADRDAIEAFLKANNIKDSEVTISPILVNPIYGSKGYNMESGVTGYSLSEDVLIESKDVEKITSVAKDSGALISKGILFSSMPLEYYYSNLSAIKIEILAKAMEDAKIRAVEIAKSADARVSKLKSAGMGVIQITAPNAGDVSDYGYYDTSSKDKKVTAVVKASFMLK